MKRLILDISTLISGIGYLLGNCWKYLQSKVFYVLLIGLSIHVLSNLFWEALGGEEVYFLGRAIGVSSYILTGLLKHYKFWGGKESLLLTICFELSLNDLLDECLFSPTTFEWNEVVLCVAIVLTAVYKFTISKSKRKWSGSMK